MKYFYNFLKEFAGSVNDRLKFPLTNAFLISWAVLNWQAIFIILFSEQPIEARIDTVNLEYNDTWKNLYYPLILAVSYTTISPWIKKVLLLLLSGVNKDNRNLEIGYVISSYEKKIELAREEVKLEVERAKHLELKDLNDTVEKLKSEIESEKLEKENLRKEIVEKERNIEKLKKNHDHTIARFSNNASHYQLRAKDLEELLDRFFIFTQKVTSEEYQDEHRKKEFFRNYLNDIESLIEKYHMIKASK